MISSVFSISISPCSINLPVTGLCQGGRINFLFPCLDYLHHAGQTKSRYWYMWGTLDWSPLPSSKVLEVRQWWKSLEHCFCSCWLSTGVIKETVWDRLSSWAEGFLVRLGFSLWAWPHVCSQPSVVVGTPLNSVFIGRRLAACLFAATNFHSFVQAIHRRNTWSSLPSDGYWLRVKLQCETHPLLSMLYTLGIMIWACLSLVPNKRRVFLLKRVYVLTSGRCLFGCCVKEVRYCRYSRSP